MSRRSNQRTALLAGCMLAALLDVPPGNAADPAPAKAAQPISWTWSTVKAAPGQPRGLAEFQRACAVCHGDGPAKPGTRALHTKYQGKEPALLADRTDLAPDYVRFIVRHGVSVMPPFRKTELSDADLEQLVAYLTRKRR
jgi:(+)-pinoresinol hydroxylase